MSEIARESSKSLEPFYFNTAVILKDFIAAMYRGQRI